jgi:carboxyl-terminal processing protease
VRTVLPGGPAQRAGLRPGDLITQVNGKPASLTQLSALLPGQGAPPMDEIQPASTSAPTLKLTVLRPGSERPRQVLLEADQFRAETILGVTRREDNRWDYLVDRQNRIAQVRVATLANGTSAELFQVMEDLESHGVRGLILDLRWCPGGYLHEAVNIAQYFVGEGAVATVRGRDGRTLSYGGGVHTRKVSALPLLVLVNGETSGGAELIAAAVQDNKRGPVAGRRTLGKASVQTPLELPLDNTRIKLTTGTFMRPSGKNLHRFPDSKPSDDWGVRPESQLEFPITPELNRQSALAALRRILK